MPTRMIWVFKIMSNMTISQRCCWAMRSRIRMQECLFEWSIILEKRRESKRCSMKMLPKIDEVCSFPGLNFNWWVIDAKRGWWLILPGQELLSRNDILRECSHRVWLSHCHQICKTVGQGSNCCSYLFIDFDKKSATRMRHENFLSPVTLFISMVYSLSMIFTL